MFKKILKFAKLTIQMTMVMLFGFAISLGVYISVDESTRFPMESELKSLDNISGDLDTKESSAVQMSRHSVLYVLSTAEDRLGFTKMSGTYFMHNKRFYVLTAAHGVAGDCEHLYVATGDNDIYDCIKYIMIDKRVDYAIIEIEEVSGRLPVELGNVMPSNREWPQEMSALNEVFYTGYPNGLGPLTFRGEVAGISDNNYIYLHSYAWPGSSGSGIFSYDGNLIGIVIALNVGVTSAGYDVLEDLVIVTPLFMIDWTEAYQIMSEPSPIGDTGDTAE